MNKEYKQFINDYIFKDNISKKNKRVNQYEYKLLEWSIKYDYIDYDRLEKKYNGDIVQMYYEATMIFKDRRYRLIDHPLPEYQHLLFHSNR
jgi:hypothetical protein